MALNGHTLPFDFPLPPTRLTYKPPPPSRSSLDIGDSRVYAVALKDLEDALDQLLATTAREYTTVRPPGTGRQRAKSSQPLTTSQPLYQARHFKSTHERRTTDGCLRPSAVEGLRGLRKPLTVLDSPDCVSATPKRVTGLRPSPLQNFPRRDASLPLALRQRPIAAPTPTSSDLTGAQIVTTTFTTLPPRCKTPPTSPKEPFPSLSDLTPLLPSTASSTSTSFSNSDSDAMTYLDSPASSTFSPPSTTAANAADCCPFETLALDSPLCNAALNFSWDWSFASTDDDAGERPPGSNASRPTSPRSRPVYTSFRTSSGKSPRQGIPQAFRDVAVVMQAQPQPSTQTNVVEHPGVSEMGALAACVAAFPAGEASLLEDVSRSGWYSSDDEDDIDDRRGAAAGAGGGVRKFSLNWGKGGLKRSWRKHSQFFRHGSSA